MLSILFVLVVLMLCVFWVWPAMEGSSANPFRRSAPPAAAPAADSPTARPESLEGVLVAQLIAGEITRGQYQKAVEGIAARDDDRHPLTVPPENGPANA